MPENQIFSVKKIKITYIFFAYIFYLYQNIGGEIISHTGDSPKWVKSKHRPAMQE